MEENKSEDLNGAKRGAGCLGLLLIIIGMTVIVSTGDAGASLGAILAFAGGFCWLAALIFGIAARNEDSKAAKRLVAAGRMIDDDPKDIKEEVEMGWFTKRKMTQAFEALRVAHDSGLALRQMMGMLGLLEEALRQSEAESEIAEVMEDVSKAFAKGNIFDGVHSAAGCLLQASAYAERTASLWNIEDLTSKVAQQHKDALAAALIKTSRFFKEAASALDKARESL